MAWKWDTVLYDRDEYRVGLGRKIWRLPDGKLAVRVSTRPEQGTYSSDFGSDVVAEKFILASEDGGLSWDTFDGVLRSEIETELPDGTLISVVSGCERTLEENKAVVAEVGRNPDTVTGDRDYWPESMEAELIERGYLVFRAFTGTLMTETALDCLRSSDGGKTYDRIRIEGLPKMGRRLGTFRTLLHLEDGTLLTACFGHWKGGNTAGCNLAYALRSEDRGDTWKLIPIGDDPNRHFGETDLLALPNGRILAMMRSYVQPRRREAYLHQSFSDDGGLTWMKPEATPIWGYPPQLTLLNNGTIHCVYAHRRYPFGIRACLSQDNAKSWDIGNEIIIRDDAMTGRVAYPMSVELDDETVLTAYSFERIPRVPYDKNDVVAWGIGKYSGEIHINPWRRDPKTQANVGGCHRFAGVSRYTQDYVRPSGQMTSKVKYFTEDADSMD